MRVTVDSELVMVQPPVPKEKVKLDEGDEEPKDSAAAPHALVKPPAKPPATPARRFHVVITGRVSGEQGHTAVVAFDEDLQKKSPLAPVFETVRLQGISRVSGDNQRNEQNFTIECLTPLRKYE